MSDEKKCFLRNFKKNKPYLLSLSFLLIVVLTVYFLKIPNYYPRKIELKTEKDYFGVTFSTKYCDDLGLDYKEVYEAILDDLEVKKIRIPVYWDEIELIEGSFDFSKYDYLFDEGEKRGVDFVVSLGHRVPRWPECHAPSWFLEKNENDRELAILNLTKAVSDHFKNRESVEFWQVENEPFLSTFGVCPPLNEDLLKRQFDLLREIDDRKIIITSSGELRFWNKEASIGDIFGSTLYRVVHNSWFGFVRYPLPTSFYKNKARLAKLDRERLMVMELQLEPWVPDGPISKLSQKEIDKSMSIDQFKANFQYAINLDFKRVYTWGVEWWYFQKKFANPDYWMIAKDIFSQ